MKINLNVDVHHLTRIEGHGSIKVQVKNGKIKEARWDTVETPRFFEVMFKNKHYTSVGLLAARICGICSISHCLCSIRATENAFKVTIPETAAKLRLLAKHGETLQSHILHVLFLAAPDFVDEPSVIPLIEKKPDVIAIAARLKGLANRLCDTVAGRTTHPVAFQVGGVTMVPQNRHLRGLRDDLKRSLDDLQIVVDLFSSFKIPDFTRETEFVSLASRKEYPFIGGSLISSDGVEHTEQDYRPMTNEYVDKNNTSKWSKLSRESYAVGALARFNNNARLINPKAAEVAASLGLKPVCHNPFMNNVAQLVECFHVVHEAIRLIDELVESDLGETMTKVTPKAGEGVGAVEAPRGILFHHYKYDKTGRVLTANCVVPTTQNNANIHQDIKSFAKQFAVQEGMTDEKLELLCSMLVRSYDPCISCSVH
jgi:sulfhydrogenase subunit alpha